MVWCNQLVTALAGLLRSIAQPPILTHVSKQAAQRHIVHLMQVVTQPGITPLIEGQPLQKALEAAVSTTSGLLDTASKKCKPRKMSGSSMVADGQTLNVIRLSDVEHCWQR